VLLAGRRSVHPRPACRVVHWSVPCILVGPGRDEEGRLAPEVPLFDDRAPWELLDDVGPRQQSPDGRVPVHRWFLAFALVLLNLADVVLTKVVLSAGGHEANPLVRPIIDHSFAPLVVKCGVALLVGWLLMICPPERRLVDRATAVVVVIYAVVVGWNLGLVIQAAGAA